jgi:hypothetical protein
VRTTTSKLNNNAAAGSRDFCLTRRPGEVMYRMGGQRRRAFNMRHLM